MANPFLERADRTKNLTNSHKRAKKQEKEMGGRLGAKLTPASGSRDVKGDLRIKGVARLELKTTMKKSFSVTMDMIGKIEAAATQTGEMPALIVEFNDGFGRKLQEVAIIPIYALETLLSNQRE